MELYNFYAAMVQLSDFYGVTMQEDEFENIAIHAWDHIGNKYNRFYTYCGKIEDGKLDLPCNATVVEAVMREGEDFHRTDGTNTFTTDLLNEAVETYVEGWKNKSNPYYSSGGYINYEHYGSSLYFKDTKGTVRIIYKGILADDKGLPMLNFKEVDAIAKYCAFISMQKQGMINKDKASLELAQMLRQQWQVSCDDARTPIYLNQNFMNQLLDVTSSWDRKRYGVSYKVLR